MAPGAVADQTPDTGHCGLFLSSEDPGAGTPTVQGRSGPAPPLEGKRTMETENNGDVLWGPPRPGEMGGVLPQPRQPFPVTISLAGVGGQRV